MNIKQYNLDELETIEPVISELLWEDYTREDIRRLYLTIIKELYNKRRGIEE